MLRIDLGLDLLWSQLGGVGFRWSVCLFSHRTILATIPFGVG